MSALTAAAIGFAVAVIVTAFVYELRLDAVRVQKAALAARLDDAIEAATRWSAIAAGQRTVAEAWQDNAMRWRSGFIALLAIVDPERAEKVRQDIARHEAATLLQSIAQSDFAGGQVRR